MDAGFGKARPKNKKMGDCRNGKKSPVSGMAKLEKLKRD